MQCHLGPKTLYVPGLWCGRSICGGRERISQVDAFIKRAYRRWSNVGVLVCNRHARRRAALGNVLVAKGRHRQDLLGGQPLSRWRPGRMSRPARPLRYRALSFAAQRHRGAAGTEHEVRMQSHDASELGNALALDDKQKQRDPQSCE